MKRYIMVFDAGTTSCRTILFDKSGREACTAQKEFTQYYPQPGWVEHDASEIWSTQMGTALEAMLKAGASAADIAAIGITNQRETTVVWERERRACLSGDCMAVPPYCGHVRRAEKGCCMPAF